MDSITSAEFRKTYSRLREQVVVTVNGHPIGTWIPGFAGPKTFDYARADRQEHLRREMTQAERDAILRRVNKG